MNRRITKKHLDQIRRNNINPGKKCRWVYRYGFVSIGDSLQMTYTNKPKRLHGFVVEEKTTPYFNLYGHVHNDNRYVDTKTSMCVSAERIGYTPISLEEIRARWTEKYLYRKENDNE